MTKNTTSRRQLLKTAAAAAAGAAILGQTSTSNQCLAAEGKKPKFQFGMASYTLRKFNLDDTLAITNRVGLKNIAFKSMHLPLDSTPNQIKAIAAKTRASGLNLYGCGVVYMKNQDQVNQAFEYAKTADMKTIIGVPEPQFLSLVDKKVKQYNIKVAIHNHGPEDKTYPTPESIYSKIRSLDKRIGLCMDIGHTQRCGIDPGDDAARFADRLLDVHIKDVTKAQRDGRTLEWTFLLSTIGITLCIKGLLLLAVGMLIFSRREVAKAVV